MMNQVESNLYQVKFLSFGIDFSFKNETYITNVCTMYSIIIRTQTFILISNSFFKNIIKNKYALHGSFMTFGKVMNYIFISNIDNFFFF